MCGISGFTDGLGGGGEEVLARQLRCLCHRGPDADGAFRGRGAVIAQNRLAIIDLEGGDPPLTNEEGTVAAVCNGEIYNFRELSRELSSRGHRLASRCDTEVLAHLAEEREPVELARALDGMFAFAVWADGPRRLILGRDRLGKKPLYYWSAGDQIVFGSELKAVLAHPAVPRELNQGALSAYLSFGYVPSPETFFAGVRSLPPGHVLTLDPSAEPVLERYWAPPGSRLGNGARAARATSFDEAAAGVRAGLRRAVERRLVADVPVGALLSGGIDSSAIVGLMSELTDSPVQTFTIGFDDSDGFDERPYARMLAERFATDHHEFVVRPDAVELIERLVWHHDQPFGDSSAIPMYLLCEQVRGNVTVALCGDGGDELFAGYERFAAGMAVDPYLKVPQPLRRAAVSAIQRLPPAVAPPRAASFARFAANAEQGLPDAYHAWISFIPRRVRDELLPGQEDWALDGYRRAFAATAGAPVLERLLELNLETYLPEDLLVKADRTSMAHGLELRSPFLDAELLDYAFSLPSSFKARGMSLKRVLKASVADLLPAPLLDRPKRGFGVPLDRWFRTDLREYVRARLLGPTAHVRRHLQPAAIDRLVAEHDSGAANHGHALWTLLTLEEFLRREDW